MELDDEDEEQSDSEFQSLPDSARADLFSQSMVGVSAQFLNDFSMRAAHLNEFRSVDSTRLTSVETAFELLVANHCIVDQESIVMFTMKWVCQP